MEHFPYLDSLWFGEGYDYNESPDYWLVEISGIPFGLFGEMLEGGGNPWRGMLYGMTSRLGWGGDPRPIWKVWDDFGVLDARMIGYWDKSCPVKTGRQDVLATAYVKKGRTLVSLAGWAKEPVECRLTIDWQALGLDPQKAGFYAPPVQAFQEAAVFRPSDPILMLPGRGWLLVVDEKKHAAPAGVSDDIYKNRAVLLEDRFDRGQLGEPWKTALSTQPKTSLKLASGAIAMDSPANCFASAERPLPPGVAMVQCSVFSGSDKGATWGPGLTLLWPDRVVRVNLRAEGRFGMDDGANATFAGMVAPESWYSLRIRVEQKEVILDASPGGKLWYPVQTYPRSQFPGDPVAVRLGKSSLGGKNEDFSTPGPAGTCLIKDLRVFGKRQPESAPPH